MPLFSILKVALDTPLDFLFDYGWSVAEGEPEPQVGQFVLVPFGRRETTGLIVEIAGSSALAPEKLKSAIAVRSQLAPLSAQWIALCRFAADYYQRPLGEVAVPGVPRNLRATSPVSLDRALKKMAKDMPVADATPAGMPPLAMSAPAGVETGSVPMPLTMVSAPAELLAAPASAAPPVPVPVVAAAGGFYLQLGAFSQAANAQSARAQTAQRWNGTLPQVDLVQSDSLYRLYGGPFASRADAEATARQMQASGGPLPIIVQR